MPEITELPRELTSATEPLDLDVDDGVEGGFDRVPDHISVHILNLVCDVKSLARCRCVNRRFAALVPQTESLLLKVDAVIPSQLEDDFLILPLLHRLLTSLLQSLSAFLFSSAPAEKPLATSPPPAASTRPTSSSPSSLLRGFDKVRWLEIELPGGDLRMAEKGAVLRWRAEFGKTLRSCVILAARRMTTGGEKREEVGEQGVEEGLKERVIWTIGALIAASTRHHMVSDVVKGERGDGMERLTVRDRDGEGRLVVEEDGLREWRREDLEKEGEGGGEDVVRKGRTRLPAMRMRMRDQKRLDLGGGIGMEGAVLVVARVATADGGEEVVEEEEEGWLVRSAFGDGVFQCAAEHLMKKPSYVLDMNSF